MADNHRPGSRLLNLYKIWGEGEIGLIITGNIMVDKNELGEPDNVVLEDDTHIADFQAWTKAAKAHGSQIWAQINHPGRQAPAAISKTTFAPSPVQLKMGAMGFRIPQALSENEIKDIVQRFANTAALCKLSGFDGVQIHGAHGYLVSQFLSPIANQRPDQWGGSIENRMRFVLEIVKAIRNKVGAQFPIGIKINSADFQTGGFSEEDSVIVVKALEQSGIDMVEISGGTYEAASMTGKDVKESTRAREAYFLPFAEKIRNSVNLPLLLTGGFRSSQAMNSALDSGAVDLIGIARPLAMEPHLCRRLLSEPNARCDLKPVKTGIPMIDNLGILEIGYYSLQLKRIADGENPDEHLSPLLAVPLLGLNYTSGILNSFLKKLNLNF